MTLFDDRDGYDGYESGLHQARWWRRRGVPLMSGDRDRLAAIVCDHTDWAAIAARHRTATSLHPPSTPHWQTPTNQREDDMSTQPATVTITDECGTSGTVTVDTHDVADAIRPWYPEAPAEVVEWIDTLQTALDRGDYTGGMESALGISIEYAE